VDDEMDDENGDDGEDDADGGPSASQSDGKKINFSKPQTRAEYNKLMQQFANTLHLVAHLYHDRSLQDSLRLVASFTQPYLNEYVETLQRQKSGQVGTLD